MQNTHFQNDFVCLPEGAYFATEVAPCVIFLANARDDKRKQSLCLK
jgi:hypothetical protein